jgi:hypothetical protein
MNQGTVVIIKKIAIILASIAGLFVVSIFAFILWFIYFSVDFEPTKFNAENWQKSIPTMSWNSVRLTMVDDLVENHLNTGMSKNEVIELIGIPDDTPYFRNYDMVYYLGRERNPIGIDSEWLVFKVNYGKIQSFNIVRD